jgi:anti-sigma factor RsiW
LKHDPERNAAAYLGGLLSGARRRMFERHIVDCEDCWREVDLGRRGRSVAESGREIAPQALRERVRAAVETVRPRRRPLWLLGGGAVGLVALATTGMMLFLPEREPQEIAAALAAFRNRRAGVAVESQLPARLAGFRLTDSAQLQLGGVDAVAHTYVDSSGDEVLIYVSDEQWPVAVGAEHANAGETWLAEKDGLVLICLDEPAPSLIVGNDVHDVELAAYTLRP